MAVYETDEIIEKVILVGVAFDTDDDTERSLDELRELWVNPDCGLKTRGVPETEASLKNMVKAAEIVRAEV